MALMAGAVLLLLACLPLECIGKPASSPHATDGGNVLAEDLRRMRDMLVNRQHVAGFPPVVFLSLDSSARIPALPDLENEVLFATNPSTAPFDGLATHPTAKVPAFTRDIQGEPSPYWRPFPESPPPPFIPQIPTVFPPSPPWPPPLAFGPEDNGPNKAEIIVHKIVKIVRRKKPKPKPTRAPKRVPAEKNEPYDALRITPIPVIPCVQLCQGCAPPPPEPCCVPCTCTCEVDPCDSTPTTCDACPSPCNNPCSAIIVEPPPPPPSCPAVPQLPPPCVMPDNSRTYTMSELSFMYSQCTVPESREKILRALGQLVLDAHDQSCDGCLYHPVIPSCSCACADGSAFPTFNDHYVQGAPLDCCVRQCAEQNAVGKLGALGDLPLPKGIIPNDNKLIGQSPMMTAANLNMASSSAAMAKLLPQPGQWNLGDLRPDPFPKYPRINSTATEKKYLQAVALAKIREMYNELLLKEKKPSRTAAVLDASMAAALEKDKAGGHSPKDLRATLAKLKSIISATQTLSKSDDAQWKALNAPISEPGLSTKQTVELLKMAQNAKSVLSGKGPLCEKDRSSCECTNSCHVVTLQATTTLLPHNIINNNHHKAIGT